MRLDGRTALITGGTQGVGAAIAVALARAGSNVVLHGLRDDEQAQETLQACRSTGVRSDLVTSDLMADTSSAVDQLFEMALACQPSIDLLVNNAGAYIDKPFLEMDYETFDRTMRLNVAAGYFLTQHFARRWIDQSVRGRVLFTGSINGLLSEPMHTAYDASKAAVAGLVRSLCVTLAPHGIRVNAMAPGLVRTPLTNPALQSNGAMEWMKLHTPNGQIPEADVCGGAAVFLMSDFAEHIHGQTLYVDGGMSASQQPDLPDSMIEIAARMAKPQ
ncbi:MAG: SDR family oxidoreductase [Pirellulaceae bacterium]|nr:SDR family oxidoreductase [Pirellulaceae bacterium]